MGVGSTTDTPDLLLRSVRPFPSLKRNTYSTVYHQQLNHIHPLPQEPYHDTINIYAKPCLAVPTLVTVQRDQYFLLYI